MYVCAYLLQAVSLLRCIGADSDFFPRAEAAKERRLEPALVTIAFAAGLLGAVLRRSTLVSAKRPDLFSAGSVGTAVAWHQRSASEV